MKPVKRPIQFATSMTANKRNIDFAYLRKNVFTSSTEGLYPSKEFTALSWEVPSGFLPRYVSQDYINDNGTTVEGVTIIENADTNVVRFLTTTDGVQFDEYTSTRFSAAVPDNNGYIHVILKENYVNVSVYDSNLYIIYTASFVSLEGATSVGNHNIDYGVFDGLNFYWVENSTGSDIFRSQPQSATFTTVFSDVGLRPVLIDMYDEEAVLFCEDSNGKDTYIFFWDKTNNTLFNKRIIEKNARLIAGGVVDGQLILVKMVANETNLKEQGGRMVVSAYNGQNFKTELNSVKVASNKFQRPASSLHRYQSIGNGVLVFGVKENESDKDILYKNWLYKVKPSGSIEVIHECAAGLTPQFVRVEFSHVTIYETEADFSNATRYLKTNLSTDDTYGAYTNFNDTRYVTNFMNNTYNVHTLKGLSVVFEKMHAEEECQIYYRTSDREDFVLLDTINQAALEKSDPNYDPDLKTAERADTTKGIKQQIYHIVKMPEGEDLPEFNEIQFDFRTSKGFSIIQAWYNYEYIERNVLE